MVCFDKTHVQLTKYLQNTETTFNKLLSPYGGHATIKVHLILDFRMMSLGLQVDLQQAHTLNGNRIVQLFLLILVLMYAHVLFLKLMMIF